MPCDAYKATDRAIAASHPTVLPAASQRPADLLDLFLFITISTDRHGALSANSILSPVFSSLTGLPICILVRGRSLPLSPLPPSLSLAHPSLDANHLPTSCVSAYSTENCNHRSLIIASKQIFPCQLVFGASDIATKRMRLEFVCVRLIGLPVRNASQRCK